MKSFEEVYEIVKKELSEERFKHSIGVMERCIEFANIYDVDIEKAKLVGIAHDIAKEIPKDIRIQKAKEYGIKLDDFEKENLNLIHAKLGAKICELEMGFSEDMCLAISAHTTARSNMTKLDKILYLSDYTEPSRELKEVSVYEKGKENLDEGYFLALVEKIKYIINNKKTIHYNSIEAYNDFLKNK